MKSDIKFAISFIMIVSVAGILHIFGAPGWFAFAYALLHLEIVWCSIKIGKSS